jgi:hypothetical protein
MLRRPSSLEHEHSCGLRRGNDQGRAVRPEPEEVERHSRETYPGKAGGQREEGHGAGPCENTPARPPAAARRRGLLEAAELAAHDLDADVVAGLSDLRDRHLEIVGDAECFGAGQALLFARLLLEHLDETWDVA